MENLWGEMQKLNGHTIELRDLHEAVDEVPNCRVVQNGKMYEKNGTKFMPVKIIRHGFRPINVVASVKA